MNEINELVIKRFDKMFGVKSKIFPQTGIILVDAEIDEWKIQITNKKNKNIILYHKNKRHQKNKYHLQNWKGSLYAAYHSIYTHKSVLPVIHKPRSINER